MQREIVVYPPVTVTDETLDALPIISGEYEAFVRGRGYDLYRIREYLPEDSARHVDWKATAKSGALKVREFTREDERKLRIVFDNPAPGELSDKAYERAVETAASIAWHFANQHIEVSFATQDCAVSEDVYEFLHRLALVQPVASAADIRELTQNEGYSIVITARSRGSIPTSLWDSGYVIFVGEPRPAQVGKNKRV